MKLQKRNRVCMITNAKDFKGGISAVVNGYHGSYLEKDYDIRYVESCTDSKSKFRKTAKMLKGYIQYAFQLFRFRPDIVHVHSSFGFSFYRKILYIYLGKAAGAKIVNHIHGAEFDSFYINASRRKRKLIRKVYEKSDVLVALSEEWKENLKQIVSENKIVVLENYSILKRTSPKNEFGKNVLFLGEVGRRKGCCDIPLVVKKVLEDVPDARFIVAGNFIEDDYMKIKEDMDRLEVAAYISFPGWVRGEKKDKLLQEADVFFLPSYNEGMPVSILDAMGYGLPIVSTTVGGIPKIVHDGVNGFLRSPGDVQGFAEKIKDILLNQDKMQQFGFESIKIVQKGYSLDAHLQKLEKIYDTVMLNERGAK